MDYELLKEKSSVLCTGSSYFQYEEDYNSSLEDSRVGFKPSKN
jgi:hypothetical protein